MRQTWNLGTMNETGMDLSDYELFRHGI